MDYWSLLMVIVVALMTKVNAGNGVQEVTINEEIPEPKSPRFSSVNVNHILRWDYDEVSTDAKIVFDVEINDNFFDGWMLEPTCNGTSRKYCEVVSGIHYGESPDCPELNYYGEFSGRVRACQELMGEKKACSLWANAEEILQIPDDDKLSPPNFEIEGIFGTTEMRIINHPIIVKHLNKSLNCYHDNKLEYNIKYWGTNDTIQQLQETSASFDMESISLRLFEEPHSETEMCVEIQIIHKVRSVQSQPRRNCFVYERDDPALSKVAITAIITGGCAVMILVFILILVKLNRVYKKVYPSKFEVPSDLANLMKESPDNVISFSPSPCIFKRNDVAPTSINILETGVNNDSSTKQHPFVLDSKEIVHLLSPEILKSSALAESPKSEHGSSSDISSPKPVRVDDSSTASDNESIPYVCTLEDRDSTSDSTSLQFFENVKNQFKSSTPVDMIDNKHIGYYHHATGFKGYTKYHSESDLNDVFLKDLPSNCAGNYSKECLKKHRALDIDGSSSIGSEIPEYSKVRVVYVDTCDSVSRKSNGRLYTTVSDAMISNRGERWRSWDPSLESAIVKNKFKRPNSRTDWNGNLAVDMEASRARLTRQTVDDEMQYIKEDMISVTNPTYSSKPSTFDLIDNMEQQQMMSNEHDYGNFGVHKKVAILDDLEKRNTLTTSNKNGRKLFQRRRFKKQIHNLHISRENKLSEEVLTDSTQSKISQKYYSQTPAYVKQRPIRRRHSCSSGSSTLSPMRDRTVSADSGYHMGSFSVSDECFSLSPPLSPDDTVFSEVFSFENSPKSARLEDLQHGNWPCLDIAYNKHHVSSDTTDTKPEFYPELAPYTDENAKQKPDFLEERNKVQGYVLEKTSEHNEAAVGEISYVKVQYECEMTC